MDNDFIENLNDEQIQELYDDVIESNNFHISATAYCYGYCRCTNGTYEIGYIGNWPAAGPEISGRYIYNWDAWLCSYRTGYYTGYKPCGNGNVYASYWVCQQN